MVGMWIDQTAGLSDLMKCLSQNNKGSMGEPCVPEHDMNTFMQEATELEQQQLATLVTHTDAGFRAATGQATCGVERGVRLSAMPEAPIGKCVIAPVVAWAARGGATGGDDM